MSEQLYKNANPNAGNPNGDGAGNTDPNNFTDFKTE